MALFLSDITTNANNLTNNNTVIEGTASTPFAASTSVAVFASASSQFLSAVNAASLRPTGNYTVEAWIKSSTTAAQGIFQSFEGATNFAGIQLSITGTGKLYSLIAKNTGTTINTDYKDVTGGTTITDGNWHHVAVVYDGVNLTLYVDGVSDGSNAVSFSAVYTASNRIRIGALNATGSEIQYFNGSIDEVRLWNTNRSSSQIANNKSVELVGNESNLQAYWPFESLSSPSASISPSSSSSASLSPSASRSPSASVSPSASISPSSSISASLSPSSSISPSSSNSPSLSPSSSSSPSSSNSPSISPSPSAGYLAYSRGHLSSLPADTTDLATIYTIDDETAVANRDGIRVGQIGTLEYMIHQFKVFVGSKTYTTIICDLQTSLDPKYSAVYLQVYNWSTHQWETIDVNNTYHANVDFELRKTLSNLTNYKDTSNVVSCRVYQLAI